MTDSSLVPLYNGRIFLPENDQSVKALIELHNGLDRLGPGDDDFSKFIIGQVSGLAPAPRIADLGCGAGAGALILAEEFRCKIKAVDFSREFLQQLVTRARQTGLQGFVEIIEADIGKLDWPPACIDLLWSEGAAYSITFQGALETWRPLLVKDGVAVISEMNYLSTDVPQSLGRCMKNLYPDIRTEAANVDLINSRGFEVLAVHRLPARAWWDNYYTPLCDKIDRIRDSADDLMLGVIDETLEEIECFREYEKYYGYTYYVMRAI